MTTLSVIVPTLNEQQALPNLLEDLERQAGVEMEVIVADGGSTDRTVSVCYQHGVRVVVAQSGRGRQMNAGAAAARGRYLLFLHADTRLTGADQFALSIEALAAARTRPAAGHFSLRFNEVVGSTAQKLRYHEAKTHLNRKNTTNGDQGMLLLAEDFVSLGGFDESLHFLEDQDMAERIRALGCWMTLPSTIVTSGRRFAIEGYTPRMLQSAVIMCFREIELRDFFHESATIYRDQDRVEGPLPMEAFLRMGHHCLARDGIRRFIGRWYGIGRFVRGNAWQLFYAKDVRERDRAGDRWLAWYDRYFDPLTDNAIGNILAMLLGLGAYYILWLYSMIRERHRG